MGKDQKEFVKKLQEKAEFGVENLLFKNGIIKIIKSKIAQDKSENFQTTLKTFEMMDSSNWKATVSNSEEWLESDLSKIKQIAMEGFVGSKQDYGVGNIKPVNASDKNSHIEIKKNLRLLKDTFTLSQNITLEAQKLVEDAKAEISRQYEEEKELQMSSIQAEGENRTSDTNPTAMSNVASRGNSRGPGVRESGKDEMEEEFNPSYVANITDLSNAYPFAENIEDNSFDNKDKKQAKKRGAKSKGDAPPDSATSLISNPSGKYGNEGFGEPKIARLPLPAPPPIPGPLNASSTSFRMPGVKPQVAGGAKGKKQAAQNASKAGQIQQFFQSKNNSKQHHPDDEEQDNDFY